MILDRFRRYVDLGQILMIYKMRLLFILFLSISARRKRGRVVDGTDVTSAAEFPYLVGLTSGAMPANRPQCGGTILDAYHILTAAHCLGLR